MLYIEGQKMTLSFRGIFAYIPLEERALNSCAKPVLGWQMTKGLMTAHWAAFLFLP